MKKAGALASALRSSGATEISGSSAADSPAMTCWPRRRLRRPRNRRRAGRPRRSRCTSPRKFVVGIKALAAEQGATLRT